MKIEDYQFGRITVDGESYTSDVIISPDGVDASWRREEGHKVSRADLAPVLAAEPDVLVIGTGAYGVMKVKSKADALARERCRDVHVLTTPEACKKFNELAGAGLRVVAALHLTC